MRKTLVVLALLGLAIVPAAMAHVEPSPEKVPANSTSKITLSAEGEESVPAVKLAVQMPTGVTNIVAHPTKGWKQSVTGRVVTWSGGKIPHGAEGKFAFTAHMPNTPGKVLVFPALVVYQDNKVVHWIGAASSDTPAPRVTLTAAKGQTNPPPAPAQSATAAATATSDAGDGGSNNWIWIVIAAAILASVAAIVLVRRRRA
jgi:LPXTG-motif cell wall-anchored protein